jgi:hypothetical protein
MKMLSNPMATLWDQDPNKPQWALVTKAWSTIRDKIGKEKAPLGKFFEIVSPVMGLPAPKDYLQTFGWSLAFDAGGKLHVTRGFDPSLDTLRIDSPNMSIADIISYCQTMGYAQEYVFDSNSPASLFEVHLVPQTTLELDLQMHNERIARRNARRERREQVRNSSRMAELRERIAYAHSLSETALSEPTPEPELSDTTISINVPTMNAPTLLDFDLPQPPSAPTISDFPTAAFSQTEDEVSSQILDDVYEYLASSLTVNSESSPGNETLAWVYSEDDDMDTFRLGADTGVALPPYASDPF